MKTIVEEQFQRCREFVLRYLSLRPRSEAELRLKLHRRGFADETITQVLVELKEQHLIDDLAFARFWRENRESFSPRSHRLIERELNGKGVAAEAIAQATAGLDDQAEALRAAQGKLRSLRGLTYLEFRKKLSSFLHRRGFGYEVTRDTINRMWKDVGK